MRGARWVVVTMLCGMLAGAVARADDDSIKQSLDAAKSARAEARTSARNVLFKAFDEQIKSASQTGNLDAVKTIVAEKDAFTASGTLPTSPLMKDAAAQYEEATRAADGKLAGAFETAIEDYTRSSKFNDAMEARRQRRVLLEGADASTPSGPVTAESAAAALDKARADYGRAIADAHKALLAAVDSRIATATQSGDLKTVTALGPVRAAADADGSIPADVTDPAILAARSRSNFAIQTANFKLNAAYNKAIHDFTRAGKIEDAQSTQAELDASGLGSGSGAAATSSAIPSGAATYPLARNLPAFLVAQTYAPVKDGIRLEKRGEVKSKSPEYFTKDFVFDVSLDIAAKGSSATVGIGEGDSEHSIGITVRSPDDREGVSIVHKDPYGDKIGRLSEPATYLVRMEKRGTTLTFSVGSEKDGAFTADITHTIADYKTFAPHLNEKSGHLFFRGDTIFHKVRLVMGPAMAGAGAGGPDIASMPITPVNVPTARGPIAAAPPVPAAMPAPAPVPASPPLAATPVTPPAPPATAAPATPAAASPVPTTKLEPGLIAQFYGDSKFEKLIKTRTDAKVEFEWAKGVAPATGVPTPHYSIRWTGQILVPAGGASAIGIEADDGARLKIDGQQLLDFQRPAKNLSQGNYAPGLHAIQIEYWNRLAGGKANLIWVLNGAAEQTVPATALFHSASPSP